MRLRAASRAQRVSGAVVCEMLAGRSYGQAVRPPFAQISAIGQPLASLACPCQFFEFLHGLDPKSPFV
jgi:hypothetical protein